MSQFQDTTLAQMLPDGRRLHLREGPIDLIVEAWGKPEEVHAAYAQATDVFPHILRELVGELATLRAHPDTIGHVPANPIAQQMLKTATSLCEQAFLTPMICVAGAVADHVLAAMRKGRNLDRAYVNNGGDIALYLTPGQTFDIGVCADPVTGEIASTTRISSNDKVGGIATSGWRGRSHSLGIADAVTVLAETAVQADASATLIANVIDLPGHPHIQRTPADQLSPDSDLGSRCVTTGVGSLSIQNADAALQHGRVLAERLIAQKRIIAAFGNLQGQSFSTRACARETQTPLVRANETFTQEARQYA